MTAQTPTRPEAKSIPVEVLPPEGSEAGQNAEWMRLLAHVMDDLFVIPGTKTRIGLDPLIGLVPGLGDGASAFVSSLLMIQGVRAGMPKIVLVRMGLNVLLNTLLGGIPIVGDAFSAFFKSNRRNFALYEKHALGGGRSTWSDWIFVGVLLLGIAGAVLAAAFLAAFLIISFIRLLASLGGM